MVPESLHANPSARRSVHGRRHARSRPDARKTGQARHAISLSSSPRVRAEVDARLGPWLDARVAEARARGVDVDAVADARPVARAARRQAHAGGAARRGLRGRAEASAGPSRGGAPAGAALELFRRTCSFTTTGWTATTCGAAGRACRRMMRERFGAAAPDAAEHPRGRPAPAPGRSEALLELELPRPECVARAARELARVRRRRHRTGRCSTCDRAATDARRGRGRCTR